MPSQNEIRQDITDRIVAGIKSGTMPWRRPWAIHENVGHPTSLSTGNLYRGINTMLLGIRAANEGYESKYWGTYRQIQSLGGQVRKGERSTRIVWADRVQRKETDEDGDEVERAFTILKYFSVFNAEQSEGLDQFKVTDDVEQTVAIPDFEPADKLIEATQADIRFGGSKAFYNFTKDFIQMPPRESFVGNEFYETCFHELSHWSEPRIGLERTGDTKSYAFWELVAEIASCYVCEELGIPVRQRLDNHAAYCSGWLESLENDPKMIFDASGKASKIADHLFGYRQQQEPEFTVEEYIVCVNLEEIR